MKRLLTALGLAGLFALAAPVTAKAEVYASINCGLQSNACFGEAYSDSGPVYFTYQFDYFDLDAIFPSDCSNQNVCTFYCIRKPGPLTARLYVYDANYNVLAVTDPVPGLCTQQDILLPWSLRGGSASVVDR